VKRFYQSLCVLGVLLAVTSRCPAADPPAGPAYKLTIVLDIAKSRAFTDPFRQQVERELREGLQAALGTLAVVDVRSSHPLLADIRARGLGPALDSWKQNPDPKTSWKQYADAKTHFVLIDLVNNKYEIQSRQFDGPTATPGPVVRTARTPDRDYVARAAALLIEQDFGISATFRSWPKVEGTPPAPVQLEFPGAGPGAPLSRWVKPNDVFAVVHVFTGSRAPEVVPWSLLQIQDAPKDDDANATCTGKLFWRYDPRRLEGPDHAGYRCVKLGAISAPVRLRFLQQRDRTVGPLTTQLTVEVRQHDFRADAGLVKGITDAGNFSTAGMPGVQPFDRVAFVTVLSGNTVRAFLPLALVDEQTPVVLLAAADEKGEELALRIRRWKEQVALAWNVHTDVFKEINQMAEKANNSREAIVQKARVGSKRATDDCARLALLKAELLRDAGKSAPDLKEQDVILADLSAGARRLDKYANDQEKILVDENSPEAKQGKALLGDAELAEEKLEYGQAIELYRKAMETLPPDEGLRKRVKELEDAWNPKNPEHAKARAFIYEVWPGLDTAGLEREMDNARKALKECKAVSDTLYPRKLVMATKTHTLRLEQEAAALKKETVDDDKPLKRIAKVSEELKKLLDDTLKYLKSGGEGGGEASAE
jgi:hypothetical protein